MARMNKQLGTIIQNITQALKEITADKDSLPCLIMRSDEFYAYIIEGIRRFSTKPPNYDLARTILGRDFISPEEIAKVRGLTYIDEQLATFSETLPGQDALEWCRDNNMMLVAGPPNAMSLLQIRDLKAAYFYSKSGGWYAQQSEKFARNDKIEPVWIALGKEPVAGSHSKNWSEQKALVVDPIIVPNAAEFIWGITTYKAVRNVFLFPRVYVRTSSVDSDGYRVYVGRFASDGLYVSPCRGDVRYDDLGLASARKF